MPFLGVQPNDTFAAVAKQTLTGDILGTTVFTLDHGVSSANDIALYINNVRQEPVTAYNASGSTLTLTESINAADDAYLIYIARTFQSLSIRGITDNTEDAIMTIDGSLTTGGDAVLNVGQNQTSGYYVQDKDFGFEISNGGVGGNTAQIKNSGNVILSHNQVQDNLILRTNNTDRITILSGGNVGIGVTDPDEALEVVGSIKQSGTNPYPIKVDSTSFVYYPHHNTAHVAYYKRAVHPSDSNEYQYYWRTSDTGAPAGANETTWMTLNTGATHGGKLYLSGGVSFENSFAPAHTLDDYEEGTWDCHLRDTATGNIVVTDGATNGRYVKIGNQITVYVLLYANGVSSYTFSGSPYFALPITTANDGGGTTSALDVRYIVNLSTAKTAYNEQNSNRLVLSNSTDSPANNVASGITIGGNVRLYGCITYKTA